MTSRKRERCQEHTFRRIRREPSYNEKPIDRSHQSQEALHAVSRWPVGSPTRNIRVDQLPPASGPQLPLDEAAEKQRATRVEEQFGQITPSLVQYRTDVLFRDLWLRPALAPPDRSLVTVSALIAAGQVAQITYHLNRAMDNGLTGEEAGEVLGHVAFYAGRPNAFSAAPVVKDVIEKRP